MLLRVYSIHTCVHRYVPVCLCTYMPIYTYMHVYRMNQKQEEEEEVQQQQHPQCYERSLKNK